MRILFILIGTLGITMYFGLKRRCTKKVKAKIVEISGIKGKNDDGGEECIGYPVYEYTVDGQIYTKRLIASMGKNGHDINTEVDIYYNPNNPEEFYEVGDYAILMSSLFFLALAIITMFVR